MRLFIGVELPADVKRAAAAAAHELQTRIGRASRTAAIRWVDSANLHITLWFLGEVDEAAFGALANSLREPFALPPFVITLHELGTFPPGGSPRVFWIGIAEGRDGLVELHRRLQERLVHLGYEPERRAFSPHLTLARVKDVRRADVPSIRRSVSKASPLSSSFTASFVTLFRSRLSPKGSQYESLLRVPLS